MKKSLISELSPAKKGIFFSFCSLSLLGFIPIITNSRPSEMSALSFAFFLSLWELIASIPFILYEKFKLKAGIFAKTQEIISQKATEKIYAATSPQEIENSPKSVKKQNYIQKSIKIMLWTGLIFSLSTFLYVLAFERAGTVNGVIAMQVYPLFTIISELIILKQRKPILSLLSTAIIITGLYLLGTQGTWLLSEFTPWFFLTLTVPILWSIAHVIIKRNMAESPITPVQITFIRVFVSSTVLFLVSVYLNGLNTVLSELFTWNYQWYAILMGFAYFSELIAWFYAVKYIDVSTASTITTPNPIITMILAALILQESIFIYQIVAGIIIIGGLYAEIFFTVKTEKKRLKKLC